MIEGSCLCGGVRFRYDGEIEEISLCHCSQCRKAHGAPYAAVGPVATERLQFLAGAGLLREYRSSPNKVRVFCSACGSPIFSARDDVPGVRRLRLGAVDTPFECANAFHIHCDSAAGWEAGLASAPRHPAAWP